jgi:putative glutamine amidotransferase
VVLNASEPEAPSPPLIGLSTYVERARYGVWDEVAALLPFSYVRAVTSAGGCPVLLPPTPADPQAVLAALDGLVLTGGPDVEPGAYGAQPHTATDSPRKERDTWELALCRQALERDLPLLGICRGLQVLNVTAGGTLHQHLPDVVGHDDHRAALGRMTPNRVALSSGSAIAAVLGAGTEGLCHHHQAVDRLGRGLRAVGFADDGTVEAIEVPGRSFAIGVQWHPEDNEADGRLFTALVEAAAHSRGARRAEAATPVAQAVRR